MSTTRLARAAVMAVLVAAMGTALGVATASAEETFILRVHNVGDESTFALSDGTTTAPLLSWGAYAVHGGPGPIFTPGQAAGDEGLEPLAEDGSVDDIVASLQGKSGVSRAGALKARLVDGVPVIPPGGLMRAVFKASPGDRLSIAIMLEQSNDLFYAFDPAGIDLFDGSGAAISADLTDQLKLWDAGTEVNQDPGLGPDTGNNEETLNQGPDEGGVVRLVDDGFPYPPNEAILQVTVEPRK